MILGTQTQPTDKSTPVGRKLVAKICVLLLLSIHYSSWFVVIASTVLNFVLPSLPQFLSSLITTNSLPFGCTLGTIVAIIVQAYLMACAMEVTPVVACSLMFFMYTMPAFVQQSL